MTTETLYEGGTILDGAGASLENHGVMVRDGRIAEVAPRDRFQGFTGFRVDFTGGTLLPVEERAKIIAELEALRAKQGGSAPKPPASQTKALTDEAANHGAEALKQIEKCSQEGAADLYPECAPED